MISNPRKRNNINACGPLSITSKGNRYLITAICVSSKFPEAIPVSDINSCLTTEFFERFGILVRHSSVYHPQSNPVERFHRTLKRLLRVLCLDAGSEWDKHLPSILLALRTVSHEKYRYTPSELVYGKNLRTPETLVMEHWMESEEEVMTDHNPLVWLNRNVSSNPRLIRWALALQPYNFRIVHRSGKSHKNADSLSRSVIDN
ncbi:retrovirus-related Pol polyprotein from transposon 17.6 [Trichonephila clavipes]|nr:retrovirus-related Pol polyprotein from transposon 17.6 [Trichonephila clavipes]